MQMRANKKPEGATQSSDTTILEEVIREIEAVDIVDDRTARAKAQAMPLINLYKDKERWPEVIKASIRNGAIYESLFLRLATTATATLADTLRKRIKKDLDLANKRTLRLVGDEGEWIGVGDSIGRDDYPAEIGVPKGWTATESALTKLRVHEGGIEAIAAGPTVVITRKLKDVDTGDVSVELSWVDSQIWDRKLEIYRAKWKSECIPRDMALDTRGIVRMAGRGVPISSHNSKLMVEWLFLLDSQAEMPTDYSTVRLGWVGKKTQYFMLGSKLYHQGDEPVHKVDLVSGSSGSRQIADSIKSRGTWEGWLKALELIGPYQSPWLAIYAACSAPLLKILGAPNFGIDFAGPSSSGKSTTLELAASTFAPPVKGQGYRGWGGTKAGTEGAAASLCDMPLLFDEGQLVPPARRPEAAAMLHSLIDGSGPQKGDLGRNGLRTVEEWRTVLISTSEDGIVGWAEHDGVQARVLEVTGCPLGRNEADRAERIKETTRLHYGHLMPKLVRLFVDSSEGQRDVWRTWYHARVEELAQTPGLTSLARRAAQYMATLDTAAHLIHTLLGVPMPQCEDVSAWTWARIQESCGGGDRAKVALEYVWAWIWAHRRDFDGATEASVPSGTSGWYGVWELSRRYVGVYPAVMEKILKESGITSTKPIFREWVTRGELVSNNGRTKKRVRVRGEGQVSMYVLKMEEQDGSSSNEPRGV